MNAPSVPGALFSAPTDCASMSIICWGCPSPRISARCWWDQSRQLPICVGETPALLLGPLTVEQPFRKHGIGRTLLDRALVDAKAGGHRLVLLVGDEAYYSRVGFKPVPKGRATMPGPVDYRRLLVAQLTDGAFEGVSGAIRPDWSKAR